MVENFAFCFLAKGVRSMEKSVNNDINWTRSFQCRSKPAFFRTVDKLLSTGLLKYNGLIAKANSSNSSFAFSFLTLVSVSVEKTNI